MTLWMFWRAMPMIMTLPLDRGRFDLASVVCYDPSGRGNWEDEGMQAHDSEVLFGKTYADGTVIFREGDVGREMFIIQDGQVEISSVVDGEKLVYGVLGKGRFFGEMALFDDQPRSATATVRGSARLMVLERDTVRDRLKGDPNIGLTLLRSMCERIRSLHQGLEDLIAAGKLEPGAVDAALKAHQSH